MNSCRASGSAGSAELEEAFGHKSVLISQIACLDGPDDNSVANPTVMPDAIRLQ